MSGDPTNARLWADADVYVAFDTTTANPANAETAFGAGWDLVGLLDGDAGFDEVRSEDVKDNFAWGGVLMKTGRRHFKLERKFTAFEDNDTTRRLRWPGSDVGELVVPRPERIKIAFETREGTTVHRLISAFECEVTVDGDVKENEGDPASIPFLATIFPDTTVSPAVLFVEQTSPTSS